MKDIREGNCPLCDHNEIIEAVPAEFSDAGEIVAAVTYDPRWLLQGLGRNSRRPRGVLVIYVCRACGYLQWFAKDPDQIPIDEEHCTRLVKGRERSRDPFR
jgi:hypothetical protein